MRTSLFLVAALSAAGCMGAADDDSIGTVGVALTAADPSGASYRLTPGTRLILASGQYYDEFSLDGNAAFIRVDVPAGDYSAELQHNAGHSTQWPLERTDIDGTTEIVIATLVTTMPAALTVPNAGQANLVLSFQVPGFGPVTFDHGAVGVTLDVSETVAGGVVTELGSYFTTSSVTADPAAPPELATRLPAVGDMVDIVMRAHVTGAWYQTSATSACAPSFMEVIGSGHQGIADLVSESTVSDSTEICVFDSEPPQIQILTLRQGEANTPTFNDFGETNWLFISYINAELPAAVFDGATLDLNPAVGSYTLPGTAYTRASVRPTGSTVRQHWYRATFTGNVAVQLILTP